MKKLFNAQFGSMLNLTKSAFAILLMFVMVGSVSAQRLAISGESKLEQTEMTDAEVAESIEAAPDCVPANLDPANCVFTKVKIEIDAPAPYQSCKVIFFADVANCGGTVSIYNSDFDYAPTGCNALIAAVDALASNPGQQNVLLRSIYRKAGKVLSDILANGLVEEAIDPFVFECDSPKKAITTNYYEGNCVSNCFGVKKINENNQFPIIRQVLCDKSSCCITKSTYCTKDGVLQSPVVTTSSTGNTITCDKAVPLGNCPKLTGVTWVGKSPCFSGCGGK